MVPEGITMKPEILGGKPVVSGTRIPVFMVMELLASGKTGDQIRADYYPELSDERIHACLAYAAMVLREESGYAA